MTDEQRDANKGDGAEGTKDGADVTITGSEVMDDMVLAATHKFLKSQRKEDADDMAATGTKLEKLAEGNIYYAQAKGIIEALEDKLKFSEAIPYPVISKIVGLRHQELAFYLHSEDGPFAVMVFPDRGYDGKVEVDYAWGHSTEVYPSNLVKRLYDQLMVVDNFQSFCDFVNRGVKGFREANPFIPLEKEPEEGDLVYLMQYATCGHMVGLPSLKDLGNVIKPGDRIGKIVEVKVPGQAGGEAANAEEGDGIEEVVDLEGRENDVLGDGRDDEDNRDENVGVEKNQNVDYRKEYVIESLSGKMFRYNGPTFDNFGREVVQRRNQEYDLLDELHVVRAKGWADDDLQKPFMSDVDAEQMIWPIMFEYAEDPRIFVAYSDHARLLTTQFKNMVRKGISPQRIVTIFNDDYGVPMTEIFGLAGGEKKQLTFSVKSSLEGIMKHIIPYARYATDIIKEVAGMMGVTEEDLVCKLPEYADAIPEEKFSGRKVRAKNWDDKAVEGYIGFGEVFQHPGEDGVTGNVHDCIVNPLSLESVNLEDAALLGVESYRQASNMFEIEMLCQFLENQAMYVIASEDEEKKPKAEEVKEFLEDKLAEIKRKELERFNRSVHTKGGDEFSVSQHYELIKSRLDENVTEPLMSFRFSEDDVRNYVLQETGNNPLIMIALDSIFCYRNKNHAVAMNVPIVKKFLSAVKTEGARTMDHVFAIHKRFMDEAVDVSLEDIDKLHSISNIVAMNAEHPEALTGKLKDMLYEEKTGQRKEHLDNSVLGGLVRGCMLEGGMTPKALEYAEKYRQRNEDVVLNGSTGAVEINHERAINYDVLTMRITDTFVDKKKCALMLMDELAKANCADARNREYLEQSQVFTLDDRLKEMKAMPRLYPVQGSNYFLKIEIEDKDRYSGSQETKRVDIGTGNMQPKDFVRHYTEKPDVSAEVQKMRDAGLPVKVNGQHKLVEAKDGGYDLLPEWELIGETNINLFMLDVHDNDRSYRRDRMSRRMRKEDMKDRGLDYELEYDYLEIICFRPDYFGRDNIIGIFSRLKQGIEHEFGMSPDRLLAYSAELERKHSALPAPEVLQITHKDE